MNNVIIKQLLVNIFDDIINKYIVYKNPFRLVMIKSKYCYICNKNTKINCNYRYVNTYIKNNMVGWIYCNECKNKVDIAEYFYYYNSNVLQYSLVNKLFNQKIIFYRLSSVKKKTIINDAILLEHSGDILRIWNNNSIGIMVSWEKKKLVYSKCIPLYNVIYFNRNLFGYSIKNFPIKNLNNKWIKLIKKEYTYLYKWEIFLIILKRYNIYIPKILLKKMFYFWFKPNLIKKLPQ
ncbi:MAG: hypothetical protein CMF96_06315 [Candidatus Marinimicrobia bacterium]|nr:hypothetical protein [Candidatus Neomarinimicrobiota bacterium]